MSNSQLESHSRFPVPKPKLPQDSPSRGGGVGLEAIAELGSFLEGRAASDPQANVDAPSEPAAWVAGAMDPKRLSKSRSLLARTLPRLGRSGVWPDRVGYQGHVPTTDWPGVRIELEVAGESVGFNVRAREDGALFDVRLEACDLEPGLRRACAEALRRALSTR